MAAVVAALLLVVGLIAADRLMDEYGTRDHDPSTTEGGRERIVIISGSRTERPELLIVEYGGIRR